MKKKGVISCPGIDRIPPPGGVIAVQRDGFLDINYIRSLG